MKYCTKCGEKNKQFLDVCSKCGTILDAKTRKNQLRKSIASLILYPAVSIFVGLIFMLAWMSSSGIDITQYSTVETIGKMPFWAVYGPLLILFIVLGIMYFKDIVKDAKKITKKNVKVLCIMTLILLVSSTLLSILIDQFGVVVDNQEAIESTFNSSLLAVSFMVIIVAPVVEEIVFRRALNTVIRNTPIFIISSSLIFGLLHWSSVATIIYIVMGVILSIAYIKMDKNLTAIIIMHLINNGLAVLMFLLI